MKILFYGYRNWAIEIFNNLDSDRKCLINFDDYSVIEKIEPDLIFFVGWSKIIPEDIIKSFKCFCLHPSKLPLYRGGSPLQHQIISGVKESAVSIFIMNEELDGGDIVYQTELSLEGNLDTIFKQIELIGSDLINRIISDVSNNRLNFYSQDLTDSKVFKRRKPSESEITIDEIIKNEPLYLYNKVRALNDPYPNAYIKCKDGKKLFITQTKYEE